jgi:hypothetical protein
MDAAAQVRAAAAYFARLSAAVGEKMTPQLAAVAKDAAEVVASCSHGEAAESVMDSCMRAIGSTGDALKAAAPALIIAAPAALALGALLRQVGAMRENRVLVKQLHEHAVALRPVLERLSKSDNAAQLHAEALCSLATAVDAAKVLVAKVNARGRIMSLVQAGTDGAKLRAVTERVSALVPNLTLAVTVGAEHRQKELLLSQMEALRKSVADDLRAVLEREREALVERLHDAQSGVSPPEPLIPPQTPSSATLSAWSTDLTAALRKWGVADVDAEALVRAEVTAATNRHQELVDALHVEMASVHGGLALLKTALERAAVEARMRDEAIQVAIVDVRAQLDGMADEVGDIKAMLAQLPGQLEGHYAAARKQGCTAAAALDVSKRAASAAAASLLLAQVPSIPPERLVVWSDVELGHGAFGVVYAGALVPESSGDGPDGYGRITLVAVKQLKTLVSQDAGTVARFLHEVRLQANLCDDLPNTIVDVHGLCHMPMPSKSGGTELLLVCELMATALDEVLHGDTNFGALEFRLPDRLALLREVAQALKGLHSGVKAAIVTHSDVKPVRDS